MTLPVRVGDEGQRYEIWCDHAGKPRCLGWSNDPFALKDVVELHPAMENHRAVDRESDDYEPTSTD